MSTWEKESEYEEIRSCIASTPIAKLSGSGLLRVASITWWALLTLFGYLAFLRDGYAGAEFVLVFLLFAAYANRQARVNRALVNEIERMKAER